MKRIGLTAIFILLIFISGADAKSAWNLSVHSNLIYLLGLAPNMGIEVVTPQGWCVTADFVCSWWSHPSSHFYWRNLGGEAALRKYLTAERSQHPLQAHPQGHHLGLYFQAYSYDYENCRKGSQSPFTWGTGMEYGYTYPLNEHLSLDLSLGMGFLGGKVLRYEPVDCHYVVRNTRYRQWFGPTKASLSLAWNIPIGKKIRKGGAK